MIKSSDGAGIFSQFFWTLVAPVVSIYNYITGYFTGRSRGGGGTENQNRGTSPAGGSSSANVGNR